MEKNRDDYIEMDYSKDFPFDIIAKEETVYIVDYSISPEEMTRLYLITNNVIWCDHHKTAIAKYEDYPRDIDGLRNINHSGCELTWLYMNDSCAPEMIPEPIRYIGDKDTWQWKYKPTSEYFCDGLESLDLHPLNALVWDAIFSDPERVIKLGRFFLSYKTQRNKEYLEAFGYKAKFEGFDALAINIGKVGSEVFESLDMMPTIGIMYVHTGDTYHVSLRSEIVDVSDLALKYGGGGHAGAAGFECVELPWVKL
jgi:oligoribonuclease NrnB/cAMP/cGMP phosphodiesterase (DHH superfamily)